MSNPPISEELVLQIIKNLNGIKRSRLSSLALLLNCQPIALNTVVLQLVKSHKLTESDGVFTVL